MTTAPSPGQASAGTPEITFRAAAWEDKAVLSRLLELYQYDLSEVWPQTLNRHGEYGFAVDRYLRNPRLAAFLFLVDGHYAGFGLVDPDVSLPGNGYWMGQFFIMKRTGESASVRKERVSSSTGSAAAGKWGRCRSTMPPARSGAGPSPNTPAGISWSTNFTTNAGTDSSSVSTTAPLHPEGSALHGRPRLFRAASAARCARARRSRASAPHCRSTCGTRPSFRH